MVRYVGVLLVFLGAVGSIHCAKHRLNEEPFPVDFKFGVATAAYQVEGAWNTNGKGENLWDYYTHTYPDRIADHSSGDIACDSYNKYEEDVRMCADLGVDFYRFSLSWSRILPTGFKNKINPDGIRYYNNLIDALLANGIEPMVTLFHWDLPKPLQDIGGWLNPELEHFFADFAEIAFQHFGDRVKTWITINEPKSICLMGYGMTALAPALNSSGVGAYDCGHTVLKAHARVYRLYDEKYRIAGGKIGMSIDMMHWAAPKTANDEDVAAAERANQFNFGWYANPIYGSGDYPEVMREFVNRRSGKEGFTRSRLPVFSSEELDYLRGTQDFLGLNMYSALLTADAEENENVDEIRRGNDLRVEFSFDPDWEGASSSWLKIVPWALRDTLVWLKKNYNNPTIIITENGCSDTGGLEDHQRVDYYQSYLSAVLDAIHVDEVNVVAYTAWSLMDNFEWSDGYTNKFGLYEVDFDRAERTRTPKLSAEMYKEIVAQRKLQSKKINELMNQ